MVHDGVTIGYPGSQYPMDGIYSINQTMPVTEYPISISFTGPGSWRNLHTSLPRTVDLNLSNSNKSISYAIGSVTVPKNDSVLLGQVFNVSCPNLAGCALYLWGNMGSIELRNACTITITTASNITNCGNPSNVSVTDSGNGVATISWGAGSNGTNNAVSSYGIIRNTSTSETGATVISTGTSGTSFTDSPGDGTYYYGVRTQGTAGTSYYSAYVWSNTVTVHTKCGNPPNVNAVYGGSGTITITWDVSSNGYNNTVSSYAVIRNTSKTASGATTITTSNTSRTVTNSPGSGNFYYGVCAQGTAGSTYYSDYSWSNQVSASGHPTVSAGDLIRKTQMDALKTYLNKGNTVTLGGSATASDGNTYKSGLTAGSTVFDDSWYNKA